MKTEVERVPDENVAFHDGKDVIVYIYAGFHFNVVRDNEGRPICVSPVADQHPAAYKDKHARNAFTTFLADLNGGAK